MRTETTLMTEGNIQEKMIRFAIPIFLGDLFQQLYNIVDALVVGNVLGENALAAVILAEIIGVLVFLFGENLIGLFADEAEVIAYGVARIRANSLFYFLLAFSHSVAGIMRGAGKSTVPMFVMLGCWCIIRVTYITIVMSFVHNITAVFCAYPITWSLSSILFLIFYRKLDWVHGLEKNSGI